MKKFELFICYLGNGATVSNSAIIENGDFQDVAHISNAGHIKYYMNPARIPADALKEITATAARHKQQTAARLDRELVSEYGYTRTLEEIFNYTPYAASEELLDKLKKCSTPEGKRELVKEYYLSNF